MRYFWCITLFLFFSISLFGRTSTEGPNDYALLLTQLETEVAKGNLIALRDLGTLLDKKNVGAEALSIIKNYTFFLKKEFDWNQKIDRQTFLDFFYNRQSEIHFFHPAEFFYITAIDVEKIPYQIEPLPKNIKTQKTVQLRRNINAFERAIDAGNEQRVEKELRAIIALNSREAHHYLLQVMQEEILQNSKLKGKIHFIITIAEALQSHPTLETLVEMMLNIQKGFLPFQDAKPILAHLTNHSLAEMTDAETGIEYFAHLMDSLETMENIRYMGYEKVFSFNKYIFPHEVDYFGRIVSLTNDYPWMKKNAIQDLMNTEHERAYLYLAADFYKNHLTTREKKTVPIISAEEYASFFTESNQLVIKLLDNKKNYVNIFESNSNRIFGRSNKEEDEVLKRNFLLYWMAHHHDFEWNQSYELFINKFEILAKTESYEKLFRRLVSTNDEVALESFVQLTEGTPAEILNLSNKYRQLLRSYNNTLPNIRHLYLEQLSLLTDFCKNNNIVYQPNNRLRQKLDRLRENIPMAERYDMENRIINSLELQEVTAVEYYSCLFENNNAFTFSIGRILDHFYSQHWNLIIQSDTQLRLYLKKAVLFKRIGSIGSCNVYLTKLETDSNDLINRLNDLLEVEADDDIIFLLEFLSPKEMVVVSSDLQEFIDNPTDFSKNDIRVLPVATNSEFQEIIDNMSAESDLDVLKKYLEYLRRVPEIRAVPIYFQLIDNETVITKKYDRPITLADLMIPVIEGAYNHKLKSEEKTKPFATEKWRTLWKTEGKNYETWVDLFYEQKLKQLQFADKLKIEIINDVFASEDFKPRYKKDCLAALTKVRPFKKIRRLKTPEKLAVATDLKYFESFFFSYKDLDDIPKLFALQKSEDANIMFDYLKARTTEFDESEAGTFWNNMFRQGWFLEFINADNNRISDLENVKNILQTYLNESDLISEYEEQTTQLNINQIETVGKSLISKLQESIDSQKDEPTKALIQQSILARASYADIGDIVAVLDKMSSSQNFHPFLFLQKDFGLPIFDLEEEEARQLVIAQHKKLSQFDFYKFYLERFGVDFLTKRNKLDYQKIFNLLQYEIVTPFVGGGGSHRDQFIYGLIKLLELQFETRLDFHKKLNENQMFYTFTSTKRATAWRAYFVEKKLATANEHLPPSFGDVVNRN